MDILIVSGFLGAGKTTFIKALSKKTGKEFAILENEYSDLGVDGERLQDSTINIWELTEGCICCSTKQDFAQSVLTIANTISPALASIFAVIIFCGIYTTSVPLLWTSIGRIEKEGTKKYKLYTVVLGIIGCVIACFLPYRSLVNVLYGLNGYLGFILVAFMLVYDIRTRMSKKVKVAVEEVAPAVV